MKKWINMSDIEDKVAIDHTLADDYGENSHGIVAEDMIVQNDYLMNGEPNAHKSFGYLRTNEMAAVLNDFLTYSRRDEVFTGYKYISKKVISGIQKIRNILMRNKK